MKMSHQKVNLLVIGTILFSVVSHIASSQEDTPEADFAYLEITSGLEANEIQKVLSLFREQEKSNIWQMRSYMEDDLKFVSIMSYPVEHLGKFCEIYKINYFNNGNEWKKHSKQQFIDIKSNVSSPCDRTANLDDYIQLGYVHMDRGQVVSVDSIEITQFNEILEALKNNQTKIQQTFQSDLLVEQLIGTIGIKQNEFEIILRIQGECPIWLTTRNVNGQTILNSFSQDNQYCINY